MPTVPLELLSIPFPTLGLQVLLLTQRFSMLHVLSVGLRSPVLSS